MPRLPAAAKRPEKGSGAPSSAAAWTMLVVWDLAAGGAWKWVEPDSGRGVTVGGALQLRAGPNSGRGRPMGGAQMGGASPWT